MPQDLYLTCRLWNDCPVSRPDSCSPSSVNKPTPCFSLTVPTGDINILELTKNSVHAEQHSRAAVTIGAAKKKSQCHLHTDVFTYYSFMIQLKLCSALCNTNIYQSRWSLFRLYESQAFGRTLLQCFPFPISDLHPIIYIPHIFNTLLLLKPPKSQTN